MRPVEGARVEWLDAARGVGIVLVVLGHVERGLVTAGIATAPAWTFFDTLLYTFHMPLFMMLAGVNVPQSWRKGATRFVTDKLRSVYYPYLLWSVLHGSAVVLLATMANNGAVWSDVYQLPWRPMWHFWFLFALMLYMILVAIVGMRHLPMIIAAVAALIASQFVQTNASLLFFLPFFVIGVVLSGPIIQLRFSSPLVATAILSVVWALSLLLLPWEAPMPYMSLQAIPAALLGSAALIALTQTFHPRIRDGCAMLGRWSMSIYLMHVLAAAAPRVALEKLVPDMPAFAYFVVCTAVGTGAPILVYMAADRLGILPLLGLGGAKASIASAPNRGIV